MGRFAVLLCVVIVICLTACGAESETEEDTSPDEISDIEEPATSTPLPPTFTAESPTDTPVPSTDTPVPPTDTPIPPTDTPVPPTPVPTATSGPTPCDDVDGTCLFFHFDGEVCTYVGPSNLKSGPVTILYHNESQKGSLGALFILTGDTSLDDVVERFSEEPLTGHGSSTWREMYFRGNTRPGESYTWEGTLDAGGHFLICTRIVPHGAWLGGVFTVED